MKVNPSDVPSNDYGILQREESKSLVDDVVEQVKILGYAVFDSGYSEIELAPISRAFDKIYRNYKHQFGERLLDSLGEINTIRSMLTQGSGEFADLASNDRLISIVKKLINGKFILNQQNGIINPPGTDYAQGKWHRDLPYQHFVSSNPLAINALFCLDKFNENNGATYVLPATHKIASFPSAEFVRKNAIQIKADVGQFIVLDAMTFHSGGFNKSSRERRCINHLYTIPYFKQQISFSSSLEGSKLANEQRELFGFDCEEPTSIEQFLMRRSQKR